MFLSSQIKVDPLSWSLKCYVSLTSPENYNLYVTFSIWATMFLISFLKVYMARV